MADSSLIKCWHKVRRAREHLQSFRIYSQGFLATNAYSVIPEYDAKQRKYLWRLNILKPIPQTDWAGIIGDSIHNARSALDYLAWRLAGSDLSDRDTLFPIYDTVGKFNASRWRLKRIHPDAIKELGKLQPYARNDLKISNLWILQELDARDKHKLLTMTATQPMVSSVGVIASSREVSTETQVVFPDFRFEQDAIIAEASLPATSVNQQVQVDGQFTFEMSFERGIIDGTGDYPVFDSLREIIWTVENVLRHFERLIGTNPDWIPN